MRTVVETVRGNCQIVQNAFMERALLYITVVCSKPVLGAYCPKCGKPIRIEWNACPYCGQKLKREVPNFPF